MAPAANNGSTVGASSVGNGTITSTKSETVNYLLLYEAMVRHQDLEFEATADHIKLTVDRIKYLGRESNRNNKGGGTTPELADEAPEGMLTYLEMRRCLLRLGYTWNRSLPQQMSFATNTNTTPYYDDDVSVASVNSSSTLLTGGTGASGFGATRDIIATDAQLIMLLTTLVEMEEKHRADRLARIQAGRDNDDDDQGDDDNDDHDDDSNDNNDDDSTIIQGLFLPEFIQAYKLIIGGMQSLLSIPNPNDGSQDSIAKLCQTLGIPHQPDALAALRARSRERTLGLLRLFGPDSKLYDNDNNNNDGESLSRTSVSNQAAGESPTGNNKSGRKQQKTSDALTPNRSNKKGSRSIPTPRVSNANNKNNTTTTTSTNAATMQAKDGLMPRLTEEQIRKLVHSKDTALAQILEDHESEMNLMANNMEELRLKELRTQNTLRKRRKRTRMGVFLLAILVTVGGAAMEYQRREMVAREITMGRENERKADEEMIEKLNGEIGSLTQKLADAEATIRYEESRYDTIRATSQQTKKELEEMQVKWLMDQSELERCKIASADLDTEYTSVKQRYEEVDEEVGWCRERLESAERSMDAMERAVKKSRELNANSNATMVVPTFEEIAKDIGMEDAAAAGSTNSNASNDNKGLVASSTEKKTRKGGPRDGKKGKGAPVRMEMKYNKTFRNAVILRQTYSALAGMAASVLLQGLVPGIGKVLGLLFFR